MVITHVMVWAMKTLEKKGLKVPADIGILSISNGFIPTLFNPAVTHLLTNGYELGKLAHSRLREIQNENKEIRELVIPAMLIEGGSL